MRFSTISWYLGVKIIDRVFEVYKDDLSWVFYTTHSKALLLKLGIGYTVLDLVIDAYTWQVHELDPDRKFPIILVTLEW